MGKEVKDFQGIADIADRKSGCRKLNEDGSQ